MLKLSHIKKSYKKNEVLTDISFTFEEGQIYPILGGPGAGRTTLFECICGDISVDDGSIVTIDKCKYFYAAKQSVLPVYITGYEFISMLCDMERAGKRHCLFIHTPLVSCFSQEVCLKLAVGPPTSCIYPLKSLSLVIVTASSTMDSWLLT